MNAKRLVLAGLLGGFLAACCAAGEIPEIAVGDGVARVKDVLGEPQGYIKSGSFEVYLYARGRVQVQDGTVTEVDLVSPEEAEARRVEQARRAEEQERVRRERRAEGERIMNAKLSDPAFASLPTYERLVFWQTFRGQYPEVNVETAYTAAFLQYQKEQEEARTQERLAELERRTAAAEARAKAAEKDAEQALRYRSYVYPVYYGSYVVPPPAPAWQRCYGPYRSSVGLGYSGSTLSGAWSGSGVRTEVTFGNVPGVTIGYYGHHRH